MSWNILSTDDLTNDKQGIEVYFELLASLTEPACFNYNYGKELLSGEL